MTRGRVDTPYPEVAEFTAHVASLYGLRRVVDIGLAWKPEVAIAYPDLSVTGVSVPEQGSGRRPPYPFRGQIPLQDGAAALAQVLRDGVGTAVLVTGPQGRLCGSDGVLQKVGAPLPALPLLVIATDEAGPVLGQMAAAGLRPEFVGRTRANTHDDERSADLVVFDRTLALTPLLSSHAPESFKVVAIMTVYNEEDVVGPAIEKLVGDGVGVYVIDNWSTDKSMEIVRAFEGRGLVGLERFPDAPSDRFVLRALLHRVAAVAAELGADWYVHHDADESRSGPWPNLGLRNALWRVDQAGFSAVDHTVANYRPIDNAFEPGSDFERHMRHFEFGRSRDLLLQTKAWKNVGPVDLATAAGHEVAFRGRRIFPYKFLLKHYPIRSQSHGERKVIRERAARWDPHERSLGWHSHYDEIVSNPSFLREPGDLIQDRGTETRLTYMPEMLTGAGLTTRGLPAWALRGPTSRTVFRLSRPVTRSRVYQWLRRVVLVGR